MKKLFSVMPLLALVLMIGFGSTSCGKEEKGVKILKFEQEEVSLIAGDKMELKVSVNPADAKLTFASKDDKVATVDASGTVTAVAEGKTIITVTAGKKTAACAVEVMRDRMVNKIYFPPKGQLEAQKEIIFRKMKAAGWIYAPSKQDPEGLQTWRFTSSNGGKVIPGLEDIPFVLLDYHRDVAGGMVSGAGYSKKGTVPSVEEVFSKLLAPFGFTSDPGDGTVNLGGGKKVPCKVANNVDLQMGALGYRDDLKLSNGEEVDFFAVEFRYEMFKLQSVPSDMKLIDFSSLKNEIKQALQK